MVNVLPIATGLEESPWAYRSRENIPKGIFLQHSGNGFSIDHFHSDQEVVREFVCAIRTEARALTSVQEQRNPDAAQ